MLIEKLEVPIVGMILTSTPHHRQGMEAIGMDHGEEWIPCPISGRWPGEESGHITFRWSPVFIFPILIVPVDIFLDNK